MPQIFPMSWCLISTILFMFLTFMMIFLYFFNFNNKKHNIINGMMMMEKKISLTYLW